MGSWISFSFTLLAFYFCNKSLLLTLLSSKFVSSEKDGLGAGGACGERRRVCAERGSPRGVDREESVFGSKLPESASNPVFYGVCWFSRKEVTGVLVL